MNRKPARRVDPCWARATWCGRSRRWSKPCVWFGTNRSKSWRRWVTGGRMARNLRILGRKISGIFPCALWQDLETRPPLPTAALVTDVGNDLGYGVQVTELVSWVDGCLEHLQNARASDHHYRVAAGAARRLTRARVFVLSHAVFSYVRDSRWPTFAAGQRAQRIARRIGGATKYPGNSSVRRVVRHRSDSSQAVVLEARLADDPLGLARSRPAERAAAHVVRAVGLFAFARAGGALVLGLATPSAAAVRSVARWNDGLALLNRCVTRSTGRSNASRIGFRIARWTGEPKIFSRRAFFCRKRVAQT